MTITSADPRNADQVAFWNGPVGERWVRRQEVWDRALEPVAALAIAAGQVGPGDRVIDIGCGSGATAIALGRIVGPRGKVLAVDVSVPMLARARERIAALPALPIELVLGDATVEPFAAGGFDLLFSRFGVMFFAEPERAFANLRTALRPGGRLAFACFRGPELNPLMTLPLEAAYEHVPRQPPTPPGAPGPFAFADGARVRRILESAGFANIALAPQDLALDVAAGGGLDAAVETVLEIGAASRAVANEPPEVRAAVALSMRRAFAPHQRGAAVLLGVAIWVVTATSG